MDKRVKMPLSQLTYLAASVGTSPDIGNIVYVNLKTEDEMPLQPYTSFEFMMTIGQAKEMIEELSRCVALKE